MTIPTGTGIRMRRALPAIVTVVLAVVTITVGAGWYAYTSLLLRPSERFPSPARFDVPRGEPFGETARRLEEAGLVPSAVALRAWARWKGIDTAVRHGPYRFETPLSPLDVLDRMIRGDTLRLKVTFPEGLTARGMARLLADAGVGVAAEFVRLAHDPAFTRSLGIPADSLEGYLFPETYYFSPDEDAATVLRTLVTRFDDVFDRLRDEVGPADRPLVGGDGIDADLGTEADRHEIVILASIVEKESRLAEERPLIAAVFRNRLRLGMPLQADPTVIYGLEGFDGNLTREHLEGPTPYNTYKRVGLPAGPIANPGEESLRAVLDPADTDHLYFVSRGDGSHEFSRNLPDHNRAVNRYQRRQQPGGR